MCRIREIGNIRSSERGTRREDKRSERDMAQQFKMVAESRGIGKYKLNNCTHLAFRRRMPACLDLHHRHGAQLGLYRRRRQDALLVRCSSAASWLHFESV